MATNRRTHRSSPTLQRRRLGTKLRERRVAAGLTLTEAGAGIYRSSSTVSRVERGIVGVTPRDVRDLLRLHGVPDHLQEPLLRLAEQVHRQASFWLAYEAVPPRQRVYVDLEQAAALIRQYECLAIPGLLQTRAYAMALSEAIFPDATAEEITAHVELRMIRQALLREDDPPRLEAVLDEAVLHRLVGGREVMREQLCHLADAAELANVTLQAIPFDAGAHSGMAGSFTMLSFPDPSDPDEIYLEYSIGETMTGAPAQAQRHERLFARLQRVALTPGETVSRIWALAALL